MNRTANPGRLLLWSMRLLALTAATISAYLAIQAVHAHALPIGCGSGSGCAVVLNSRWSHLHGIPIGLPAEFVYLGVLLASLFMGSAAPATRRWAWMAAVALALAAIVGAVTYITIQLLVLKSICPWCMADHALGLTLSGLILALAPWGGDGVPVRTLGSGVIALILMGGVLAIQAGQPQWAGTTRVITLRNQDLATQPTTTSPSSGDEPDSGGRVISLLNGQLKVRPAQDPILGSPEAPHIMVVLVDYCCPHCRATHAMIRNIMSRYPGQFAVVILPMPRNAKCNPGVIEDEPRFDHACELARLAMAVWRAAPAAFPAFDAWLFESPEPRDPVDAQAKAESLVPQAVLQPALADPWVDKEIAKGVKAYNDGHSLGVDHIPVLLAPEWGVVVGEPESEEALQSLLEEKMGLKPTGKTDGAGH